MANHILNGYPYLGFYNNHANIINNMEILTLYSLFWVRTILLNKRQIITLAWGFVPEVSARMLKAITRLVMLLCRFISVYIPCHCWEMEFRELFQISFPCCYVVCFAFTCNFLFCFFALSYIFGVSGCGLVGLRRCMWISAHTYPT